MTQRRQSRATAAEKPQRTEHVATRLSDLPDVLTIRQVCAALNISRRTYNDLKTHGAWKIPEIDGLRRRFSKAAVQRFIESNGQLRLMRSAS